MTVEGVIEGKIDMLVCSPVVIKGRVMGYGCYGHGGKFEFDFQSHLATNIDLKEIPVYFECKYGVLILRFDKLVLCKSVLEEDSDELSEITCYPIE